MKVETLREQLVGLPDEMDIKMSIDPEGNGFYSLSDAVVDYWDEDDNEPVYEEESNVKGLSKVLLLWP